MPPELILPLISRWIHILSAIVAVGGALFLVGVLRPVAAAVIPVDQQAAFRHAIMKRFKLGFHPAILLFLVTGFYNYLAITRHLHEDQPLYHALFGTKFLLALVAFALGIIATSTMRWSERLRQGKTIWVVFAILLVVIVLIGGVMKTLPQQV